MVNSGRYRCDPMLWHIIYTYIYIPLDSCRGLGWRQLNTLPQILNIIMNIRISIIIINIGAARFILPIAYCFRIFPWLLPSVSISTCRGGCWGCFGGGKSCSSWTCTSSRRPAQMYNKGRTIAIQPEGTIARSIQLVCNTYSIPFQ